MPTALPGRAARLKQLVDLWHANAARRAEDLRREAVVDGEACARQLVPTFGDDNELGKPFPVAISLLGSAGRKAASLYQLPPDRESATADAWAERLWGDDFDSALAELDEWSLQCGAALAVLTPVHSDPDGDGAFDRLAIRVYRRSRYEVLEHPRSPSTVAAALVLLTEIEPKPNALAVPPLTSALGAAATLEHERKHASRIGWSALTHNPEQSLWLYVDERETLVFESSVADGARAVDEQQHNIGACPAAVASRARVLDSLGAGKAWGGSDAVATSLALDKLLEQANHCACTARGQYWAVGEVDGTPTFSPTSLIVIKPTGGQAAFGNAASGANMQGQLEVGRRLASLEAVHLDVPLSSIWRDADPSAAEIQAAQLASASLLAESRRKMLRAEREIHRLAAKMARTYGWGELAKLDAVRYKTPTPPQTATERNDTAALLADRGLATREELAATIRPELSATEIAASVEAAADERKEEVADRATIAGHAADLATTEEQASPQPSSSESK